jgi:hypothetical protein
MHVVIAGELDAEHAVRFQSFLPQKALNSLFEVVYDAQDVLGWYLGVTSMFENIECLAHAMVTPGSTYSSS